MSLEKRKPKYVCIYRTHYPIPDRSNIDEERAAIAAKSITEKYKEFGISLNFDRLTYI